MAIKNIKEAEFALCELIGPLLQYKILVASRWSENPDPDKFYFIAIVKKHNGDMVSLNTHPLRRGFQETHFVKGDPMESLKSSDKSLTRLIEML